jgi:hypothetical protein
MYRMMPCQARSVHHPAIAMQVIHSVRYWLVQRRAVATCISAGLRAELIFLTGDGL